MDVGERSNMEVDKDLNRIAEYLSVCLGKDEQAKKDLAFIGVKPAEISDEVKKEAKKAMDILKDNKKNPVERINSVLESVKNMHEKAPPQVGKYVLHSVRNRLSEALINYELESGRPSTLFGTKGWNRGILSHLNTSFSLEMFLSEDKKVALELKKLGVAEVPPVVKEAAKKAKDVLKNEKLKPKERALKAVDILMEPLLPTYSSDRKRKDIQELTPEIKSVIWQIADELATGAT